MHHGHTRLKGLLAMCWVIFPRHGRSLTNCAFVMMSRLLKGMQIQNRISYTVGGSLETNGNIHINPGLYRVTKRLISSISPYLRKVSSRLQDAALIAPHDASGKIYPLINPPHSGVCPGQGLNNLLV